MSTKEMKQEVTEKFTALFGDGATANYFSPGRINLIGEHTDYNGGYVFPAAISIGTFGVARKPADSLVKVYSLNLHLKMSLSIHQKPTGEILSKVICLN